MRWPWVGREHHETVGRLLGYHVDYWVERAKAAEALSAELLRENGALVKDLLALKREGFVSTPKPSPVPAVKASPSDEAITMRAGTDGRLRQHLTNWRNVARVNGAKEEELAERILRWDDPDSRDD